MSTLAANPLNLIFNTYIFFAHDSSFLFTGHTDSIFLVILQFVWQLEIGSECFPWTCLAYFLLVFPLVCSASCSNPCLIKNFNNQSAFSFLLNPDRHCKGNLNSDFMVKTFVLFCVF